MTSDEMDPSRLLPPPKDGSDVQKTELAAEHLIKSRTPERFAQASCLPRHCSIANRPWRQPSLALTDLIPEESQAILARAANYDSNIEASHALGAGPASLPRRLPFHERVT